MKRLFLYFLFLLTSTAVAAPTEYEVKAAFLYNFAKFTQWPSATDDKSLNVCLLGNGPYRQALQSLEGKSVRDQVLNISVLSSLPIPDDCQILFVTASKADLLDEVSRDFYRHPGLLTISDIDGFSQVGGIIEFKLVNNRLRFLITGYASL